MKNRLKLVYQIASLLHAIAYGLVAYFVIYQLFANGDVLLTYLFNFIFIMLGLFLDNKARKFAMRKTQLIREMYAKMGSAKKVMYVFSQGFFITAMYIFYVAALILSQVATLSPDFLPFDLGSFFISIEYGIILLVVLDKLKELATKDVQWLKDYFE